MSIMRAVVPVLNLPRINRLAFLFEKACRRLKILFVRRVQGYNIANLPRSQRVYYGLAFVS